jgi:chaperonin GroEL
MATIGKDDTIFLEGAGDKHAIQQRGEQIRDLIANTTSDYEKEKLQERLAKLSGGVAVIKVGGASEIEVGEKKDRFVDALNATRAAVEEGIVPGGGTALLKASKVLDGLTSVTFDEKLGVEIVKKAVTAPARTIVNNAGADEGSVVVGRILEQYVVPTAGMKDENESAFNYGYDARNGEYVDMIKAGIIDPLKVVRTGLVDASGVASLLTTTEVIIADAPKPDSPPMAGGMPGMGGMGGMM